MVETREVILPDDFTFACPQLSPYVFELFRNDEVLTDKAMDYYSVDVSNQCTEDNPTEFELCSDRLTKDLPSYIFDQRGKVRPGPNTPTVNFTYLKKLLLSNDISRE